MITTGNQFNKFAFYLYIKSICIPLICITFCVLGAFAVALISYAQNIGQLLEKRIHIIFCAFLVTTYILHQNTCINPAMRSFTQTQV